ncbi:hypothetical protein V8B55DRAFT_1479485 [Mucor lusitanicus]
MPSSWGELPQELLESIIDKIGDDCALIAPTVRNRCLIQLQLTCKRWSSVAREVFYNDEFEINVDLAKKLVSCGRNHRQKLWRLKKIMITYELALDVTLKKLLSMCPNLTHLCVLEQPYTDTDSTGSTDSFDERERFYIALTKLSRHHHLAKLRMVEFKLEGERTNDLLDRHMQAMLQLKGSLTHLSIVDATEYRDDSRLSRHFVGLFDRLQDFAWLTSLELHIAYYCGFQEMDPWIQQIGPNVTALSITVEAKSYRQDLQWEDSTTVVRHTPLKLLRLDIMDLNNEDLEYIAYKFDRVSDLQMTYFFAYLITLPHYSIQDLHIPSWRLNDIMTDLPYYFHITHLKICSRLNFESEDIDVSLTCLAEPQGGGSSNRGQACLSLTMNTNGLAASVAIVCEALNADVLELEICHSNEEILALHDHEFEACSDQGTAVCIALILLPSLTSLIASYSGIDTLEPIRNLGMPKLSLNHLQLGNFTRLPVFFQLSQRVQHIETWIAPEFSYFDIDGDRHDYVIRMHYTTFGEIKIDCNCAIRFIVAVCTNSSTSYHGIGVGSNLELPTQEDFESDDDDGDDDDNEADLLQDPDHIAKIVIYCYNVKKIKVRFTTLIIEQP